MPFAQVVQVVGLEPTRTEALDPKSSVSAIPPHPDNGPVVYI